MQSFYLSCIILLFSIFYAYKLIFFKVQVENRALIPKNTKGSLNFKFYKLKGISAIKKEIFVSLINFLDLLL